MTALALTLLTAAGLGLMAVRVVGTLTGTLALIGLVPGRLVFLFSLGSFCFLLWLVFGLRLGLSITLGLLLLRTLALLGSLTAPAAIPMGLVLKRADSACGVFRIL